MEELSKIDESIEIKMINDQEEDLKKECIAEQELKGKETQNPPKKKNAAIDRILEEEKLLKNQRTKTKLEDDIPFSPPEWEEFSFDTQNGFVKISELDLGENTHFAPNKNNLEKIRSTNEELKALDSDTKVLTVEEYYSTPRSIRPGKPSSISNKNVKVFKERFLELKVFV